MIYKKIYKKRKLKVIDDGLSLEKTNASTVAEYASNKNYSIFTKIKQ